MKKYMTLLLCLLLVGVMALAQAEDLVTIRLMGIDRSESYGTQSMTLSDQIKNNAPGWQKLTEEMAKRGVKLELDLIPADQYDVVCQTRLATGLDCDIFNITPLDMQTRMQLVTRKMLQPVNQLIDNYCNDETKLFFSEGLGSTMIKRFTVEDGNMYWLPEMQYVHSNGKVANSNKSMLVRRDWLDALGMEMPETLDEFTNMLIAFQENDMNGSGEKDEILSIKISSFGNGIAQWFGIGPELAYIKGGNIESPWYNENMKDYVTYMRYLIENNLVDTSGQSDAKMAENKVSATYSWTSQTWLEPSVVVQDGAPYAYYVGMQAKATDEPPYLMSSSGHSFQGYDYAITSNCKNPEAAAAVIDYLYTMDYAMLTEMGLEGYTYYIGEDGIAYNLPDSELETDDQKLVKLHGNLWCKNAVLPAYINRSMDMEIENCIAVGKQYGHENGWTEKGEVFVSFFDYEYTVPYSTEPLLAVATIEESARMRELSTDLKTYSDELLTKLVLGQKSLDDWDSYIADLQRLGLDEYIAIMQARYDRAK